MNRDPGYSDIHIQGYVNSKTYRYGKFVYKFKVIRMIWIQVNRCRDVCIWVHMETDIHVYMGQDSGNRGYSNQTNK